MPVTGKLSLRPNSEGIDVEWSIKNFFSLSDTDGVCYSSPDFSFNGDKWYLGIYPNGSQFTGSSEHIDLGLGQHLISTSVYLEISFSLKTVEKEKNKKKHVKYFGDNNIYNAFHRFISRSELLRRQSELVPQDVLTVVCKIKKASSARYGICSYCKRVFDAESLSSHQKRCLRRPIKCPDCLDVVDLQKWLDKHECQKKRPGDYKCRKKVQMAVAVAIIVIAFVTGYVFAYSNCLPLPPSHSQGGAEVNRAAQSGITRSHIPEASTLSQAGAAKTYGSDLVMSNEQLQVKTAQLKAVAETLKARESELNAIKKEHEELKSTCYESIAREKNKLKHCLDSEKQNWVQLKKEIEEKQSKIDSITKELRKKETDFNDFKKTNEKLILKIKEIESEKKCLEEKATENKKAVKKIQTSENNKANNRSDVVGSNEFEASSSNETSTTDIKKSEGINKTLAAEMNKTDKSEFAGSDIPEASAAVRAATDESEPLPQPVLMVTEVSSTYLEVVWVLPEESKTNAAHIHYIVLFRKCETQWQEVSFLNASRTSYSLTNLNSGMPYQIYVMAVDSRFSRPSEIATVRTSDKVVNHSPTKGHGKHILVYAATIIILVIVIASVYSYSKTSFSALHHYGVTFNNPPEDCGFVTDINHLLNENRGIDVTFELETPNGKTKLFAHKLILAVMSSYFADEFYDKGRNKEHQVIPLNGIDPKPFEQMIRYCYGEKLSLRSTDDSYALFKVASEFKVISLRNLCHTFFKHTKIGPGNVFSILKISVEMEDQSLQDMCYKILQEKTREVMSAYDLCDVTPAMVYTLLNLPKLSLNSEYQLINWLFNWGKVKAEDKDSSCISTRDYLAKLLRNMNFLALTVKEFAMLTRDNPNFFNSDEIASVSMNIVIPGTREMPVWHNEDLKVRVYTGSNE